MKKHEVKNIFKYIIVTIQEFYELSSYNKKIKYAWIIVYALTFFNACLVFDKVILHYIQYKIIPSVFSIQLLVILYIRYQHALLENNTEQREKEKKDIKDSLFWILILFVLLENL